MKVNTFCGPTDLFFSPSFPPERPSPAVTRRGTTTNCRSALTIESRKLYGIIDTVIIVIISVASIDAENECEYLNSKTGSV